MITNLTRVVAVCIVAATPIACRGEAMRGECRFHQPLKVAQLPAEYYEGLDIARSDTDPETLLYATGEISADKRKQEVLRIFSQSSEVERLWIPYEAEPVGYKWFASQYPTHPLIKSNTIRFEYLGEKSEVVTPTSDVDGRLRFEDRPHFTGTRRLMYGNQPLLEQDLRNWTDLVSVGTFVQIEPDGDRIVLICSDAGATQLAVFSRAELDRNQGVVEKK